MPAIETDELCILVLQGGGALGAYQAGVFDALENAEHTPHWVAGISIGAINAALIAGNPPATRLSRLREFWRLISSGWSGGLLAADREYRNAISATHSLFCGVPGFFAPRIPPPFLQPEGTRQAISFYDTTLLQRTLEDFVDFDLLNSGTMRLSVGAVNVRSGNFAYFDTSKQRLDVRHIMASGALPPGFPPIEIDGEHYWDGGLVSNTPLQYVLEQPIPQHLIVFQVDLFPARGHLPTTLSDVWEREKDIRYSSRTRLNTRQELDREAIAKAAQRLLSKLPTEFREDPDAQALAGLHSKSMGIDVVHLIYRSKHYERHSKDYEFSRLSMEEHWQSGHADMQYTLHDPRWRHRRRHVKGMRVFDLVPADTRDAATAHDRRRPSMQGFRRVTDGPSV